MIEKEQELRRIRNEELGAAMDIKILDEISGNIQSGKEKLTPHSDVMNELRTKGYNV
jgi:hypothetical protein